jgi:hypothetical protein
MRFNTASKNRGHGVRLRFCDHTELRFKVQTSRRGESSLSSLTDDETLMMSDDDESDDSDESLMMTLLSDGWMTVH